MANSEVVEPKNDNPTSSTNKKKGGSPCSGVWQTWMLALSITTGLSVHYVRKQTNNRRIFTPAGMISQSETVNWFSTYLCEKINTTSSRTFDAYLLQNAAEIDPSNRDTLDVTSRLSMDNDDTEREKFYLLSGSVVNVSVCFILPDNVGVSVKALVFQGNDDYDDWSEDREDELAIEKHIIHDEHACKNQSNFRFSFRAGGTDRFYVVFTSNNMKDYEKIKVYVHYALSLTKYNLNSSNLVCERTKHCDVALDYASDEDIVVSFRPVEDVKVYIDSSCDRRIWYWVVMFGIIPAIIPLLLTSCCCCCWLFCDDDDAESPGTEGETASPGTEGDADQTRPLNSETVYSTPENYSKIV